MEGDRVGDLLFALLPEPIDDPLRMLLRPLLVVGVVQQSGDGPGLGDSAPSPPYLAAAARMTISTARAWPSSDAVLVHA